MEEKMRKSKITKKSKMIKQMASLVRGIIEKKDFNDHKKAEILKELKKTKAWENGVRLYYGEIDYDDLDYDEEPEWNIIFPLDGNFDFKSIIEEWNKDGINFCRNRLGGQCDRAFVVAYQYGKNKYGKPLFKTEVACDYYNCHWRIMEELADFRELAKMRDNSLDIQMSTPVRWLGAFNTGTEGDKAFTFEEVIKWETSEKEREVAAQLFERIEEIGDHFKNGDSVSFCKLGVIYDPSDVVEAYDCDAYTKSLGPILVPSRWEENYYRSDYGFEDIVENLVLHFYKGDVYDLMYLEEPFKEYFEYRKGFSKMKNVEDILNDIFDEEELNYLKNNLVKESQKDFYKAFDFLIKKIESKIMDSHIKWEFKRKWHSEAIIAIGAKPQGIVVRGTISKEKYEIVQKIAVEKGLYILHV